MTFKGSTLLPAKLSNFEMCSGFAETLSIKWSHKSESSVSKIIKKTLENKFRKEENIKGKSGWWLFVSKLTREASRSFCTNHLQLKVASFIPLQYSIALFKFSGFCRTKSSASLWLPPFDRRKITWKFRIIEIYLAIPSLFQISLLLADFQCSFHVVIFVLLQERHQHFPVVFSVETDCLVRIFSAWNFSFGEEKNSFLNWVKIWQIASNYRQKTASVCIW